jgi:UPF0271 protein
VSGTTPTIDLNADLGEGMANDDALLAVVTSANVACGGHAGDDATMRRVCDVAVVGGIAIGAHVAYDDRDGFGRRDMEMRPDALAELVGSQVDALATQARAAGGVVAYVKPHGALYNRIARDPEQAEAVVVGVLRASVSTGGDLALLGLPGSVAGGLAATMGVAAVAEAFADRAYSADGSLVPRSEPGAVLEDADAAAARAVAIATGRPVRAADGTELVISARSLCVHGDTPGAVLMARRVRGALEAAGVEVQAFARLS